MLIKFYTSWALTEVDRVFPSIIIMVLFANEVATIE